MTAPTMFFDELGIPYYKRWGLPFDHDGAFDLGEFTPPDVLGTNHNPNPKVLKNEVLIADAHFGSPLSHHAQQMTVLNWMRENRGFDKTVKATVHFSTGTADLFLQAGYELWEQVEA